MFDAYRQFYEQPQPIEALAPLRTMAAYFFPVFRESFMTTRTQLANAIRALSMDAVQK